MNPLPVEKSTDAPALFQTSYQMRSSLPSPLKSPTPNQSGTPHPVSQLPCMPKLEPVESWTEAFPSGSVYQRTSAVLRAPEVAALGVCTADGDGLRMTFVGGDAAFTRLADVAP